MADGVGFPFPSLLLNEGRTYGQPEVVLISLPQVATGLRLRLPGSFRRRGFQPDLLMPQEALLRRGRFDSFTPAKPEEDAVGNQCRIYDNNISCRSCMFCDYVFYNKAKW